MLCLWSGEPLAVGFFLKSELHRGRTEAVVAEQSLLPLCIFPVHSLCLPIRPHDTMRQNRRAYRSAHRKHRQTEGRGDTLPLVFADAFSSSAYVCVCVYCYSMVARSCKRMALRTVSQWPQRVLCTRSPLQRLNLSTAQEGAGAYCLSNPPLSHHRLAGEIR